MFKLGKNFVQTRTDYIIRISALYDDNNPLGIEVEDVGVDVNSFEVTFSTSKTPNRVPVFVRPLGHYQEYEFHPIEFNLTDTEASEAYANLPKFIGDLWNAQYEVFDQNPYELAVWNNNRKYIHDSNIRILMDESDKNLLSLTPLLMDELKVIKRGTNIGFSSNDVQ